MDFIAMGDKTWVVPSSGVTQVHPFIQTTVCMKCNPNVRFLLQCAYGISRYNLCLLSNQELSCFRPYNPELVIIICSQVKKTFASPRFRRDDEVKEVKRFLKGLAAVVYDIDLRLRRKVGDYLEK